MRSVSPTPEIELLVIDGCPHAQSARDLLAQALADVGLGHLPIQTAVIASDEDAARRGFTGSPSFFARGEDLFASPASPSHSCRLYPVSAGLSPLPDPGELRQALRLTARQVPPQ